MIEYLKRMKRSYHILRIVAISIICTAATYNIASGDWARFLLAIGVLLMGLLMEYVGYRAWDRIHLTDAEIAERLRRIREGSDDSATR